MTWLDSSSRCGSRAAGWFARGGIGYRRERIAPTGSCVAVIVLGAPIIATPLGGAGRSLTTATGYLIGPHHGPVLNEPTGETHAVGIITTLSGAARSLAWSPPRSGARWSSWATPGPHWAIRTCLLAESELSLSLELLTDHLLEQLDPAVAGVDRCAVALARLDARPTIKIRKLAAMLGVSNAFLDRSSSGSSG